MAAGLLFALGGMAAPSRLSAQDGDSPATTGTAGANEAADKAAELERSREALKKAAEDRAKLEAEVAAIAAERTTLNADLLATAGRIREKETATDDMEDRLATMVANEADIRRTLDSRRDQLSGIIGALARMGRRPAPAVLVRPEDALASIRSAILLGAVVPELRTEAETLAASLAELVRVRAEIEKDRAALEAETRDLQREHARLEALVAARQERLGVAEGELATERARAERLAREVQTLEELVAKLNAEAGAANRAAEAAAAKPSDSLAALNDPGRLEPAIPFADAKGRLPLPVTGVRLKEFGAPDGFGGTEKGLSLATRGGAQVVSPCDGWVVYAGPFRSYGQLLILNTGGGYHVLLAGMERISVGLGQFVLAGEPVAAMGGAGARVASTVATGSSQPVLYVEFRKDGASIDPSPWWAGEQGEKVQGEKVRG